MNIVSAQSGWNRTAIFRKPLWLGIGSLIFIWRIAPPMVQMRTSLLVVTIATLFPCTATLELGGPVSLTVLISSLPSRNHAWKLGLRSCQCTPHGCNKCWTLSWNIIQSKNCWNHLFKESDITACCKRKVRPTFRRPLLPRELLQKGPKKSQIPYLVSRKYSLYRFLT